MDQPLELSIILLTVEPFATLARVLAAYSAQTVRTALELVIVTPAAATLALDESALAVFGAWQVVEIGPFTAVAAARAAGVLACRAPVVVFGEDHCFPAPDWAAALIDAHRQPWVAVGPVFGNANPDRLLSWANLFMAYGPYVAPLAARVSPDLPGHNSSYKRERLVVYGDRLATLMDAESVLHADLQAQGGQLFLNSAARVYHANMTRLSPALETAYVYGRLYAASRAQGWPLARRLLYIVGAPLLPWVRLRRGWAEIRRSGRPWVALPGILAFLWLLFCASGLGEFVGYAFGAGGARAAILRLELRRDAYLAPGDRLVEQWP